MNRAVVALSLAFATLTGCSTAQPKSPAVHVNLVWGSDDTLDQLMNAARTCGYSAVNKVLGSHLEPMVVVTIPHNRDPKYQCVEAWIAAHPKESGQPSE